LAAEVGPPPVPVWLIGWAKAGAALRAKAVASVRIVDLRM
jgi:hypothetical protein